ncbi:Transposase DDE domain-containing protein [Methylobacterium sp. UNC378MF]|nr:Transposase DDE domain-containing protein [Methylobacterium sp. UNC378MF]
MKRLPSSRIVLADKGCDSDAIRQQIEAMEAAPNIPPKVDRRWKPRFSPVPGRGRNAIERMFGRLNDFRRIAALYDWIARNHPAALCLAVIVRC